MGVYTRAKMVSLANSYNGCKQGSTKHKDLVNTFNKVKPNGEVGNYTCAWCAITVTALLIKAGFTKNTAPMSYNCGTLISRAKALGQWKESDGYTPKLGDIIIYNWSDSGKGELKTGASHTGIVVKTGNPFTVLEGNKGTSHACGTRKVAVNARYTRGFITPKYAEESKKPAAKPAPKVTYRVGGNYTLQDAMKVRTGAGTKYPQKKRSQLTADGKKHALNQKMAVLKRGTVITCTAVSKDGNWIKCPSGWICARQGNTIYVK